MKNLKNVMMIALLSLLSFSAFAAKDESTEKKDEGATCSAFADGGRGERKAAPGEINKEKEEEKKSDQHQ